MKTLSPTQEFKNWGHFIRYKKWIEVLRFLDIYPIRINLWKFFFDMTGLTFISHNFFFKELCLKFCILFFFAEFLIDCWSKRKWKIERNRCYVVCVWLSVENDSYQESLSVDTQFWKSPECSKLHCFGALPENHWFGKLGLISCTFHFHCTMHMNVCIKDGAY